MGKKYSLSSKELDKLLEHTVSFINYYDDVLESLMKYDPSKIGPEAQIMCQKAVDTLTTYLYDSINKPLTERQAESLKYFAKYGFAPFLAILIHSKIDRGRDEFEIVMSCVEVGKNNVLFNSSMYKSGPVNDAILRLPRPKDISFNEI